MAKNKVEVFGINTSGLKVPTNKEMNELFLQYKKGDIEARDKIINGNLKLVLSIISKFRNRNIDMNDLFQVGVVGLIKAVDNFNLDYGVMFSTYAVPLILGEVKRLVRTDSSLRIARSIRDTAYKILKFKEEYSNLYGVEPSDKIIARELNIDEVDIKYSLDAFNEPVSIFEPIYSDGGDTIYLIDQIGDSKSTVNKRDSLLGLHTALDRLEKKERDILVDRYILGLTQSEMAINYGVSQAQISRIEKRALLNAKKLLDS